MTHPILVTGAVLDVTDRPREDFETIARRYAAMSRSDRPQTTSAVPVRPAFRGRLQGLAARTCDR
jgi:hypothetical protein